MASQELRDAMFIKEDNRANFKQVIAKRSDLARFSKGRMAKAGVGLTVTYPAGLVLGLASSGADSGRYKAYSNAAVDGSEVAVGVLSEEVTTDEFDNGSLAVIIKEAELFQDALVGLDAAGEADLSAKKYVEAGVNIISIRG